LLAYAARQYRSEHTWRLATEWGRRATQVGCDHVGAARGSFGSVTTSKKPMQKIEWTDVTSAEGCRYHRRGAAVIEAGRGTLTIDVCVPLQATPWLTIRFTKTVGVTRRQDTCRYESLSVAMANKLLKCWMALRHPFEAAIIDEIWKLLKPDAPHIDQAMNASSDHGAGPDPIWWTG
jgi:hypothetical protein